MSLWDERYSADGYLFGTEPNQFLVSCAPLLSPGQRALAVADGEGRNGVWLAGQGLTVVSFDGSPVAVAKAGALATERGVTIEAHIADVDTWEWEPESFDVVVAIFVQFATPEQRRRMWAGIWRTLRPGGLLLLQGYRVEQLRYGTGGPPCADHLYTEAQLRTELVDEAGLELVSLVEHDDEVHEGTGHDGMSALVDVIARRPR